MRPTTAILVLLVAAAPATHAALTVDAVVPDGPAAAAGVRQGDRLVRLDDVKLDDLDDLERATASRRPGDVVKLVVERGAETIELPLSLGARPGGGVMLGVRLSVTRNPSDPPHRGTVACLSWIEETYRLGAWIAELELSLGDDHRALHACVEHDTQRMTSANATRYCDNIFKVHCSGLDLLTEIGETLVARCERTLGRQLGKDLKQDPRWKTCAQHTVFDGYTQKGAAIDDATCRAAYATCGASPSGSGLTFQHPAGERQASRGAGC